MTIQVGAFEAKTHFARLLAAVQRGERVTITRRGRPVAVLVSPKDVQSEGFSEAVQMLSALRERTKASPGSLRSLRDEGRKW